MGNLFSHLTNFTLNKESDNYINNESKAGSVNELYRFYGGRYRDEEAGLQCFKVTGSSKERRQGAMDSHTRSRR